MKIDLKVVTSSKDSVLRVPKGPAFDNSDKQNVFVINGNSAIRREVSTGLKGAEFIEIKSGLNQGERVVTSDISSFRHMKQVEIEN
jgi:HlyD family secretion protein